MTQRTHRGSARKNIGAIFSGLGEIMDRLSDLGGELTKRFTNDGEEEGQEPFKAVYGFSIKVGGPGEGFKVEPFGNGRRPSAARSSANAGPGAAQTANPPDAKDVKVTKDAKGGKDAEVPVHEVREPICDTFVEGEAGSAEERFRIIAEMPGISEKELSIEIEEDILTISAHAEDKHYRKEVLLPRSYPREGMTVTCNNGIVDIHLRPAASPSS